MIHLDEINAGGHNGTDGGYFYHTVENIDIGIPDNDLLIIQEMHNAESGKVVRQSIGLGMTCYLQSTTYQNRDDKGRFMKTIEFFGTGLWRARQREILDRELERQMRGY